MGQARRNKLNGFHAKKMRFIYLMKLISKYNEKEISEFMRRRFK